MPMSAVQSLWVFGEGILRFGVLRMREISSGERMRHSPSGRSWGSFSSPMEMRVSLVTWFPVAANMRRTWW